MEAQLASQQEDWQRQAAEMTQQAEDRLKAAVDLARAEVGHLPQPACLCLSLPLSCLASLRGTCPHPVVINQGWDA